MPKVTDIPLNPTTADVEALKGYSPPPYDLSYKRRNWEAWLKHKSELEDRDLASVKAGDAS